MKLFELSFTLLREFKELEVLFDLLNQAVSVKGTHLTVSVKSEKNVPYVEILLYCSSKIPLIGITRDLELFPSDDSLNLLDTINFENTFLKLDIKDSKTIIISGYDSLYEYIPRKKEKAYQTIFDDNAFEELFTLDFSIPKSYFEISDLICIMNSMLTNEYFCFLGLRNSFFSLGYGARKKTFTLNFFTNDMSRPSLFFNTSLYGEFNSGNITKYNLLCSQPEWYCKPKNFVQVYVDKLQDKKHNSIIRVHVYLFKDSESFLKIKKQCKLLDHVNTSTL